MTGKARKTTFFRGESIVSWPRRLVNTESDCLVQFYIPAVFIQGFFEEDVVDGTLFKKIEKL